MVDELTAGEERTESPLDDVNSIDLDINSLLQKFVAPIERYRSFNAPDSTGSVAQGNPQTHSTPQESRVHAFYRVLGLPTIVPNGKFFSPGFDPTLDGADDEKRQEIVDAIPAEVKSFVKAREDQARTRLGVFSTQSVNSSVYCIAMSVINGQRKFAIADRESIQSLTSPPNQTKEIKARATLIDKRYRKSNGTKITNFFSSVSHPLAPFMTDPVVSGNLDPNSGSKAVMVAAPFLSFDDTEYENGKHASRPGIEFILRLRLRQQNISEQTNIAVDNIDLQDLADSGEISRSNQRDIASALSGVGVSDDDIGQILEKSGRVELYTLNDLVKTYKGLIKVYVQSLETIERVYKHIRWVPLPKEGGPEKGTESNSLFVVPAKTLGSWLINQKITKLQAKAAVAKQQLDIGETIDGQKLMFGDFVISEFTNLISTFEEPLEEQQAAFSRFEVEASDALRTIELIGGEISGLGLIDIIAIYMALWSLDISVLLNLIDDNAVERLQENIELRTLDTAIRAASVGNAGNAYRALAERIQTILSYGDGLYEREISDVSTEGGDIARG